MPQRQVAVKVIRNNDTMRKAAETELDILRLLTDRDPDNRKHCIRLLDLFEFRDHLCMVFEPMALDLREVLKKFGKDVGINIDGVKIYAKQLFFALRHMQSCGVVHADLKPDNILVNSRHNVLKICDFGSAFRVDPSKAPDITPYLVSRFYRAPEITLAMPYGFGIDMWAAGCTLYELYTGQVLYNGKNNNEMLRKFQETNGAFPIKMVRRHRASYETMMLEPHFEDDGRFRSHEPDVVTGRDTLKVIPFTKPRKGMDIDARLFDAKDSGGSKKNDVKALRDLLERIFHLDPAKRLNVRDAMQHRFLKA